MQIIGKIKTKNRTINVYENSEENIDLNTVESFGEEWSDFKDFKEEEIANLGVEYFDIINDTIVNKSTVLADFGCGSGRFSKYWQQKVKKIYAIDPSIAVLSADNLIGKDENVVIVKASIANLPFEDNFFDFGMSIGVMHHIPDTQKAMIDCVSKVKPGGYFYTYLYYKLENRGKAYKLLWNISNIFRNIIANMPKKIKNIICELIAATIYLPFIFLTRMLIFFNANSKVWSKIPLSYYYNKSFYIIRNDARDRFGTPLEQRFSKKEIEKMMINAGLINIVFSENMPYWHAIGQKK